MLGAFAVITVGMITAGPAAQAASGCTTTTKYYDTAGYYTDIPTVGVRGTNYCSCAVVCRTTPSTSSRSP
ncbi:hypothetical protein [Streptomyces sp. NPDC059994]|uniref:hypothetical protein n=1 Tax=Streptomyces sp. NPDC059994 TaxID=3347029 RepID=UPI0036919037